MSKLNETMNTCVVLTQEGVEVHKIVNYTNDTLDTLPDTIELAMTLNLAMWADECNDVQNIDNGLMCWHDEPDESDDLEPGILNVAEFAQEIEQRGEPKVVLIGNPRVGGRDGTMMLMAWY